MNLGDSELPECNCFQGKLSWDRTIVIRVTGPRYRQPNTVKKQTSSMGLYTSHRDRKGMTQHFQSFSVLQHCSPSVGEAQDGGTHRPGRGGMWSHGSALKHLHYLEPFTWLQRRRKASDEHTATTGENGQAVPGDPQSLPCVLPTPSVFCCFPCPCYQYP